MPILSDDQNPVSRKTVYDQLKIEFSATEDEIKTALKKVSFRSLPAEEQKRELEGLKKSLKVLKNKSSRVRLNALILDKIDSKMVEDRLSDLPNLKTENIQLPELDLAQVFLEGQSMEIAEGDFRPIKTDSSLEIDFDSVEEHFRTKILEKQIIFEL